MADSIRSILTRDNNEALSDEQEAFCETITQVDRDMDSLDRASALLEQGLQILEAGPSLLLH